MAVLDVVQVFSSVAMLLAAGAAVRLWVRHRSEPSAWLAATFLVVAAVIVVTFPLDEATELPGPAVRVLVLALLAVPYLLFRFASSVAGTPRPLRLAADGVGIVVVASTLLVPRIDQVESWEMLDLLGRGYLLLVLTAWALFALLAAWLLVRASLGRSGVVRRRLQVLAVAAAGLALVIPGGSLAGDGPGVAVTTSALTAVLGLLFLVGFAPPSALRAAWSRDDERRLFEAALDLMTAQSPADVAGVLVPGVRRLLGADRVVVHDEDGSVLAADEEEVTDEGSRSTVERPLGDRSLQVVVASTVPLFGPTEDSQLDQLALLAELAFERTRLIQAERTARAAQEQANRDLEAFVYTTSHDLKNPVLAVLGYLDIIMEDHGETLPPDLRHLLERVQVNSRHMEALIRDLLELSRVARVQAPPEWVELERLVDDVATDLASSHGRMRVVRGELPVLWANPTRVRQLLTNLMENAARHGGRDDVTVSVERGSELGVERGSELGVERGSELESADEDEMVRLRIRDDGDGIPAAHRERVFGVFERLAPDTPGGTGMGLAICRRIVETLGGTIRALPAEPTGTCIEIALPPDRVADRRPDLQSTPTMEETVP